MNKTGNPQTWNSLLPDDKLMTLDEAMGSNPSKERKRRFPLYKVIKWVVQNPKIIPHGVVLSFEIIESFLLSLDGKNVRK